LKARRQKEHEKERKSTTQEPAPSHTPIEGVEKTRFNRKEPI